MASISDWISLIRSYSPFRQKRDIDILYQFLYERVHDLDAPLEFSSRQSQSAFGKQWEDLPEGNALLSDAWFRDNVVRIITEEEIQVRPEWFKGKSVLDAGCGNGRWSYGFARLGCHITAVDINQSGLTQAKTALEPFDVPKRFIHSSLEQLPEHIPGEKFDLVFSWGVLHHCHSFTKSLDNLVQHVSEDGILYLYLYGRESVSFARDLELFKQRLMYNTLPDDRSRYQYLLKFVGGDTNKVHNAHDLLAPLINRRFEYEFVEDLLKEKGFQDIFRTIRHTEVFVRALRHRSEEFHTRWILPQKEPPYWFFRYN